jgi:hypothetical protein
MSGEEAFEVWAPDGAAWSAWAKPVLFAQGDSTTRSDPAAVNAPDPHWIPAGDGRTAIVVDVAGAESVAFGLVLARHGYRPVPLYNTSLGPAAVVDAAPIASLLLGGAAVLRGVSLHPHAPPAFLLDARRMTPSVPPGPGKFDNRWIAFPQDFPSAAHLQSRGVDDVLLVHGGQGLQDDLAHVLLRWQQAGIRVTSARLDDAGGPRDLIVKRPSMFRRAWYRALAVAGLRRNNAGGFGAAIPIRVAGSGIG